MTSTAQSKQQPLPLADILRDLALLRASDIHMAEVCSVFDSKATKLNADNESSVQQSYEFVKEARAALRMQNRSDLDGAGDNLERLREELEGVLKGLEETS